MVAYACFHLHNFLEMSFFFFFFLRNSEQIRGLQKLRVGKREMNVVIKRSTWGILTVLKQFCVLTVVVDMWTYMSDKIA